MGSLYHLLCVVLLVRLVAAASYPCSSATYVDSYTSLPSAPVFPTATLSSSLTPTPSTSNPLTQSHWSEKANIAAYRAPLVTPTANPSQTNCPHMGTGLKNWHDPSVWGGSVPKSGQAVTIPTGVSVLVSSCSIDPTAVFGVITIPKTSALIFGDATINISAVGFNVMGSLYAGTQTCRLRNKVSFTLYGSRNAQTLPADPWIKGMGVTGSIDLHGALYTPTWTRLAMTAKPNDTYIFIQDIVNWQVGQSIVITTSELKDSRDWHRNEQKVIKGVYLVPALGPAVSAIQLDSPLAYNHFGGREYQVEVALLTRNVLVQGDPINSDPTDTQNMICKDPSDGSTYPCENSFLTGFGAHIFVNSVGAQGRFSGVEMFRVGQTNVLGRYPIHYHLLGNISDSNYQNAFVQDSSVHNSYFRCYAIHGTSGARLYENTAYDVIGHCYFLEDGVEENNTIAYNQGAHIHPLGPYYNVSLDDNLWYAQYLPTYYITPSLLLPSDMAAGVFYFTNTYNDIYGNAASGGWAGFAIPSLPLPVKLFANVTNMCPANRPFRSPFRGNSAHSSGHWWATAGGIYVGGELSMPGGLTGVLQYTSGRSLSRDTCTDLAASTPQGNQAGCYNEAQQLWLRFEDNKVFLANRGLQNWGDRSEIIRFELHDVSLSMNVFGEVWIDNMLMECRSANNRPTYLNGCPAAPAEGKPINWGVCNVRDYNFWSGFGGFQWYDVGQKHILTNTIFRNCREDWNRCIYGSGKNCSGVAVFTSLTHSDEFVPELMQLTAGILYQNVSTLWKYSTSLTDPEGVTVSGRDQNWYDIDGSASQMYKRTMIGSARALSWWKYNSNCILYAEAWKCPLAPGDAAASLIMNYDPTYEKQLASNGGTMCVNGNWDGTQPCPVIGAVSHFGAKNESDMYQLGSNAKVTGPIIQSSGGWFIRFKQGTPSLLNINNVQVDCLNVLLLAFPYPAGTTFTIWNQGADWCGDWAVCRHNYTAVSSISAVIAAFGDAYFWDNSARILYIRVVSTPTTFGDPGKDPVHWSPYVNPDIFSRDNFTLNIPSYQSYVYIQSSCTGTYCAPQNDVAVPAALSLPIPPTATVTLGYQTTSAASGAATTGPTHSTGVYTSGTNDIGGTDGQPASTGGQSSSQSTGQGTGSSESEPTSAGSSTKSAGTTAEVDKDNSGSMVASSVFASLALALIALMA